MMGTCITRIHAVYTFIDNDHFKNDLDIPQRTERRFYGRCDVRPDEVGSERFVSGAQKLRRVMDRNSGSWAAALQRAGRRIACLLCL